MKNFSEELIITNVQKITYYLVARFVSIFFFHFIFQSLVIRNDDISRFGAQHGNQLQGLDVAMDQLHLPGDCEEQGWGVPPLRPLQGVPHRRGRALQEP